MNPRTRGPMLSYRSRTHILADPQSRVMVRILLDGEVPMNQVRSQLRTLGVSIGAADPSWRSGILEGYIPLDQAEAIAQLPGVAAVHLIHAPWRNAGSVTSQGAAVLKADQANQNGVTGAGITIGILSDSFNMSGTDPDAFADVSTGDLPGIGVPDLRPGLKFLSDGGDITSFFSTDEGRAVAEIAYDMAPNSSLCFATAVLGPLAFANNIRRLRADSQCAADVLVDDITYPDEPVFSDGPISQAIDDVATSATLAGKPVAYFTSAGNGAGLFYSSDLRFVADADARAISTTDAKVDLSQVPDHHRYFRRVSQFQSRPQRRSGPCPNDRHFAGFFGRCIHVLSAVGRPLRRSERRHHRSESARFRYEWQVFRGQFRQ